jgi:hypothetical protein
MQNTFKVGDLVTWRYWYSQWNCTEHKAVVTGLTPKGRVRIEYPIGFGKEKRKATVMPAQLRPRVATE